MLGMLRYTDAGSVGAGYLADALLAGGQWVLNLPGQRLNTKGDPIDAFYYMIYIYYKSILRYSHYLSTFIIIMVHVSSIFLKSYPRLSHDL